MISDSYKQRICIWTDSLSGSLYAIQVRAEAALLVEKYEDLAYQEKEQKEALIRQVCFGWEEFYFI